MAVIEKLRAQSIVTDDAISEFGSTYRFAVTTANSSLISFLTTVSPTTVGAAAAIIGAWVQSRYGRKVRIKVGDVEAEARTVEEIEQLLEMATNFHDRYKGDDE